MSDLSKIAEMHYRLEQLREFKFRSMLSVFMQEVSQETCCTMMNIHSATGISIPDISGYRSDRKILTEENAIKLADYFNSVRKREPIKPSELLAMQSVGQMIILKDRKSFLEEFQERIKQQGVMKPETMNMQEGYKVEGHWYGSIDG